MIWPSAPTRTARWRSSAGLVRSNIEAPRDGRHGQPGIREHGVPVRLQHVERGLPILLAQDVDEVGRCVPAHIGDRPREVDGSIDERRIAIQSSDADHTAAGGHVEPGIRQQVAVAVEGLIADHEVSPKGTPLHREVCAFREVGQAQDEQTARHGHGQAVAARGRHYDHGGNTLQRLNSAGDSVLQ